MNIMAGKSTQAAEIRFAVGKNSLGRILVARSERGVCAILLGDDADALVRDLRARFPHARRSRTRASASSPRRMAQTPRSLRATRMRPKEFLPTAKRISAAWVDLPAMMFIVALLRRCVSWPYLIHSSPLPHSDSCGERAEVPRRGILS